MSLLLKSILKKFRRPALKSYVFMITSLIHAIIYILNAGFTISFFVMLSYGYTLANFLHERKPARLRHESLRNFLHVNTKKHAIPKSKKVTRNVSQFMYSLVVLGLTTMSSYPFISGALLLFGYFYIITTTTKGKQDDVTNTTKTNHSKQRFGEWLYNTPKSSTLFYTVLLLIGLTPILTDLFHIVTSNLIVLITLSLLTAALIAVYKSIFPNTIKIKKPIRLEKNTLYIPRNPLIWDNPYSIFTKEQLNNKDFFESILKDLQTSEDINIDRNLLEKDIYTQDIKTHPVLISDRIKGKRTTKIIDLKTLKEFIAKNNYTILQALRLCQIGTPHTGEKDINQQEILKAFLNALSNGKKITEHRNQIQNAIYTLSCSEKFKKYERFAIPNFSEHDLVDENYRALQYPQFKAINFTWSKSSIMQLLEELVPSKAENCGSEFEQSLENTKELKDLFTKV